MVVSRTLQSHYSKRYGAVTIYIPNGTPLRERRAIRQIRGWGLEPSQYILFLGRFSPEKNCHLLVDAYERLGTEVQLVLAGGASASDAYARSLRQHENDKIRFFDYVSGTEFDELLTNAMLFVLPSDLEGLSLALLEAMGAGLCVLASDIPENRELVDGAGFLFRPGNVADIERMLRFLVSDSSARAWAGERAKHRIQQQYLWPDITAQVEAVYLDVLGWKKDAPGDSGFQQNVPPEPKPARSVDPADCPIGTRRAG